MALAAADRNPWIGLAAVFGGETVVAFGRYTALAIRSNVSLAILS